jgi:site-specific DNA-methyltransferase (adenine-specific)
LEFGNPDDFIVLGDSARVLPKLPDERFQLIYVDPPFNTGKVQQRRTLRTEKSVDSGDRVGFAGRSYTTTEIGRMAYLDAFDDYLGWLGPLLEEARRLLSRDGTLVVHLDYREVHYVKVFLDSLFGRDAFLNEVVWAYDYGGRKRDRWPQKHDTLLVYVKTPGGHFFSQDQINRIPYLAPGLVTAEKRDRGKLPTDVWWHTIVPTNSHEKTGYPNQKPEGVLRRVLQGSSMPDAWILDFFAGSGTTAAVSRAMGRRFVMVDSNDEAISVMRRRLGASRIRYVDEAGRPLDRPAPDGEAPSLF